MTDKKWIYEKEEKLPEPDNLLTDEAIFHNANGYLGVRSCFEEGYPQGYDTIRGTYLNGFYDIAPMKQAEKLFGLAESKQTMLNVADFQTVKLTVDGEPFSVFEGTVREGRRYVDMQAGVSAREVQWISPAGKEIRLTVKRMASFALLPLFTMEYEVEAVNFAGEIELCSVHSGAVRNYSNPDDPRVAGESLQHLIDDRIWFEGDTSFCEAHTAQSGLKLMTAVRHTFSAEPALRRETDRHEACLYIRRRLEKRERFTMVKYAVLRDSLRTEQMKQEAGDCLEQAVSAGMPELYRAQREYLDQFWERSELTIEGDDELDRAVRYNIYQLIQSVGKDEHGNIAAKGLSGEGYEGHYFWDTEMYIQPFFALTNPEICKNLIAYRYAILDCARENAGMMGHKKGALYPWRTIAGSECSGFFPAGTAQYHINADIAYAVMAYYRVSADEKMMEQMGAEILIETARLFLELGNYYEGRFMLHCVTGPDEYTCLVNNNYYTNMAARHNLQWAAEMYLHLEKNGRAEALRRKIGVTREETQEFERAARAMYLPYDETLGINPQDDSFLTKKRWELEKTPQEDFPLLLHHHPLELYRYQVCKQADTVMAHFLYEGQSDEVMKNSLEYYEKITTHDSSLSTCIFSMMCSRLGFYEKAYDYFGDSAKLDLFNTHNNTKDGIHTANMGGNYMAIVYGFGGVRIREEGLFLSPQLPAQWSGFSFRITYKSSRFLVTKDREGCRVRLLAGPGEELVLYGEKRMVTEEIFVREAAHEI